jgi:hypothetical protein
MLSSIIPSGRFEMIRDAIGRVLTAELANQKTLASEDAVDIAVFLERTCPIDKEELPLINIVYADTEFPEEPTCMTSLGDNKYLVECYVNSESDPMGDGDKKAAVKLAKIMGMIRTILMNNRYLYLDFSEKFIQTRKIRTITRTQPRMANDALNTISGVIEVHYLAEEVTELETGTPVAYLDTVVKLSDTDKGYKYVIENS